MDFMNVLTSGDEYFDFHQNEQPWQVEMRVLLKKGLKRRAPYFSHLKGMRNKLKTYRFAITFLISNNIGSIIGRIYREKRMPLPIQTAGIKKSASDLVSLRHSLSKKS